MSRELWYVISKPVPMVASPVSSTEGDSQGVSQLDQVEASYVASNERVLGIIMLHLSEMYMLKYSAMDSAQKIWKALEDDQAVKSHARAVVLRKSFANLSMQSAESVEAYITRGRTIPSA